MKVELQWITPDAEDRVAYMARVSNPNAELGDPHTKLIKYLIDHKHWSPFEMVCACVSIETTRDIARQILRHRAFHFQEFSQRYAVADEEPEFAEARVQDPKNRQNSFTLEHGDLREYAWANIQQSVWDRAYKDYKAALGNGIAKEIARKILPEGLTRSRLYMQGTLRDWIHYLQIRTGPETQKEHREVAESIFYLLKGECPIIMEAAGL